MTSSLQLGHNILIIICDSGNRLYITANILNTEECPVVINVECSNSFPDQECTNDNWSKTYKYKYDNMPKNDELLNRVYLDLKKFTDQRKKWIKLIM
uniref:Uncharacterized protein n=1 Tax=Pithovirus LCPAC102 TaxID=2506587 RepID=A0A481Z322_9VIRU|nr:MAG: hypothetical protein LCPAC102_01050 [Pithovirus LCPAC102]